MNDNDPKNTVVLGVQTKLDVPVSRILVGAMGQNLQRCVVIGRDSEGRLYVAGSNADVSKTIYDIEIFKRDFLPS